jgi:dimethylglycine dehydrogenase
MKSSTRVLIIGGGVVGCSVAYHLTKLGWSDVMLLERSELTSGSTWHAAGGFHTLNGDTNMAALQGYTIRLYKELEEITGMSCGLHHVGGVTLADTPERLDMFRAERAKHRFMGLETEIIGPEEIAKIAPVTNVEGILGGLYDPLDGHLDPSGTTHAYAKAARMGGAEIVLHTKVLETNPRPDGTWDVVTDKGTIHAEHVVNAAGLWAREVGHMAGIELPLHPMEHQYLVTDDIPEIYERGAEHPHVMDPAGESYLRQEGRGLCIGFYEQTCRPWAVDGTPWEFGHELLPDDFDKIEDSIAFAYRRFPVLERAGREIRHPRPLHLRARWQPAGRPRPGPAQLLVGLRRDGGVQPGRRRGPVPRAMDGGGRARARRLRHGRGPLRPVPDARLHAAQGGRELPDAVLRLLPQRGTARRAAPAHDADVRRLRRDGRGLGAAIRAGGGELLRRAGGAAV